MTMHLFHQKSHIDFLGMRYKFFIVSVALLGGSFLSLATRGVKYSIDFTGGTSIQLTFEKPVDFAQLRQAADKIGWPNAGMQRYTGSNTVSIRVQADIQQSAEQIDKQILALQKENPGNVFKVDSKSYVGPAVGKHLFQQALWAILLSLGGIIAYVAFRFENPIWGVAHIIALLHTVIATYGLFSVMGTEIDLLIISAILTVGGYSIHDTIIIFDRMREKLKIMRREPMGQVMNESMNETLSRTVITSFTVLVVVSLLYFFGGQVIHNFAMAMVFGTIVGTYSSIAVAAPLVYEWSMRGQKNGSFPAAAVKAAPSKPVSKR